MVSSQCEWQIFFSCYTSWVKEFAKLLARDLFLGKHILSLMTDARPNLKIEVNDMKCMDAKIWPRIWLNRRPVNIKLLINGVTNQFIQLIIYVSCHLVIQPAFSMDTSRFQNSNPPPHLLSYKNKKSCHRSNVVHACSRCRFLKNLILLLWMQSWFFFLCVWKEWLD